MRITLLQSHPTGETINWSQSAKQLQIPGKNAGQVLKEYAIKQGFNVLDMEQKRSLPPPRAPRKKKETSRG